MNQTPRGVPDSLRFAFQEYELEKLDLNQHAFTIIERTLAYGNKAELHWLFACYGREHLINWLHQGGWRTLPRRRLLLWTTYFNLKPFPQRRAVWPH